MNLFNGKALNAVVQALGITMQRHHNALSDARACAEIYLEYLNGRNPEDLTYPRISKKNARGGKQSMEKIIHSSHLSVQEKRKDLSNVANADTIFYNKKVVVSGNFSRYIDRKKLEVELDSYGAFMQTGVNRKTNILVLGADYGQKKMNDLTRLKEEGIDILVLNEIQLYEILKQIQ